ncbi:MAG: hypothetical protein JW704_03205 [Anaerolineaceae bacterium]|nr:hypothetical protein [Anaerolineaceae bacterium]MBN2678409.1 hypothetical protein [Anaerolineaceae bacterium]
MTKTNWIWLIPIVLLAILPACSGGESTIDTFAIYTAAANTVQAELTNAAVLTPSSTATEMPTETPTPTPEFTATLEFSPTPQATATTGQLLDMADFVGQSVADQTTFTPGTAFRVVWTLRNVGPTEWTNLYSIKFLSGDQMSAAAAVPLTQNVKYNESAEVGVDFITPATLGAKTSNWCLYNASNQCFYPFFIQIVVVDASASTATPTITITPTP